MDQMGIQAQEEAAPLTQAAAVAAGVLLAVPAAAVS